MNEVSLESMNNEQFLGYFEDKIKRYAEVLSTNVHEVGEEPLKRAINQLNNLLPQGILTPNHFLFNIKVGEELLGFVWIKVDSSKSSAFLYEIYIHEEYRGLTYGSSVMEKIENWLRQQGIRYFKLHVFGDNIGARRLYERLGFDIAGINMLKTL